MARAEEMVVLTLNKEIIIFKIFRGRVIFQTKCAKPVLSLMQFTFKTPTPGILLMSSIYQYVTFYICKQYFHSKEERSCIFNIVNTVNLISNGDLF